MTDLTPQEKLDEPLNSTSKDILLNVKPEQDNTCYNNTSKKSTFQMEKDSKNCLICGCILKGKIFDIYKTTTGGSRCLLSEFMTKTTKIMFERDKVWSKKLCQLCYDLIIQLDLAETEFLNLKNEFLVILNRNGNISTLNKILVTSQTQTEEEIGKIEFCTTNIKYECEDISRGASPIPQSDSDDEPLAGKKEKEKVQEDLLLPVKISEPIKCEVDLEIPIVTEVFSCRSCKSEFNTKAQAAVHAYSVHRIDVAKDPDIIKVKGISSGNKESKKRRAKKKAKKKTYIDLDMSDFEDANNDEDWSIEKVTKPNKTVRTSKRTTGKILKEPILISPNIDEDIKPFATKRTQNKSANKELQKKLASTSVTIKKVTSAVSLANPIHIVPLEDEDAAKLNAKAAKKDKLTVVGGANTSAVLDQLQSVGLEVKCDLKSEKRSYVKKQKQMLECTECSATFSSQTRLDFHMVKHAGSHSPYICEICGASYKHKKACDIHVGMHKGISPWKCSICAKIFPSKGALSRHEAIHTGTPNYQCDLCGKSFIHTSSFKMHKLSHSGVKPHSCSKCGLALMTRSHLKRHQRVHSGEKRHECSTCGKKFSERYNLYAHQKSHDPTGTQVHRQMKSHDCTVCDASFNRRYVLEKHMETAHQRVMDPGPKKTRNTMTKLLKQQALQGTTTDQQDVEIEELDVKLVVSSRGSTTTPPANTADSTSSTLIESQYQQANSSGTSISVVAKEETSEQPPGAHASSQGPAVVWQGLYQLANDYPLRMHGVDYVGYLTPELASNASALLNARKKHQEDSLNADQI